jgi:universal stress protein A
MKPFKKILVPVDFSAHSDEAIRVAADLSQRYDGSVSLLYVYEPVAYSLPEGYVLYTPFQLEVLFAELAKSMQKARDTAIESGARNVDTRQVDGAPAREVTEIARTDCYDLIVMGSHGRRGFNRLLMGSVAEKVLRLASCPVLCVKASES